MVKRIVVNRGRSVTGVTFSMFTMSILSASSPPLPLSSFLLPLSGSHSSADAVAAPSSPSSGAESFSVDELLNFWDFEENEDMVENKEATEPPGHCWNANAVSSSFSSSPVLSCERLQPEISLPAHDEEDLEWLSFIIDDSLSEFPAEVTPFPSLPKVQNRSDEPLGVSPSCATVYVVSTEDPVPPKAKRSKRPRALTVGWSSSLPSSDSSSTTSPTGASSCLSASSSSFSSFLFYGQPSITGDLYESYPPPPPPSKKTKLPKKRGRKPKQQPASAGSSGSLASSGERRCSHCGAQKTPQWRAGPLGAKTLCNACGVRYKSGRLLPEYRPACSPTYVDNIHSSSHRKVLELRRRKEAKFLAAGPQPVATC